MLTATQEPKNSDQQPSYSWYSAMVGLRKPKDQTTRERKAETELG
jgi:hypothetical protein